MTPQEKIDADKLLAQQKVFVPTIREDRTLDTFSVLLGFFMGLGYAFSSAFVHAFDLFYNKKPVVSTEEKPS